MLTTESRQADFPSLSDKIYLNTAAEGIPPQAVLDALSQYGQDKLLGMDGRSLHEAVWQSARDRVAALYEITADEVSICSCSSEAYNLAALALNLQAGDEVIINDLDFPAGATPWLQPSCPATVKLWQSRDGALRVEDLQSLLSSNTRLVTVSRVSFFNGFKAPLPPIVDVVKQHSSALLAVDVTQALGRVPLDLAGVDLIVSSTHKWILASHGGGLVGVRNEAAERLTVPAGGWFNLQNAFEADRFEKAISKPGAASFAVGMPNYPAIYAINAGLGYIQSVGVEAIDTYCQPLMKALLDGLKDLQIEMLTPPDPASIAGIIAFRHPKAAEIHARLHANNIHIMSHAGRLRIAVHGYNTMEDIERVLRELRTAIDTA